MMKKKRNILFKKNTPPPLTFLSELLALTVWGESEGCALPTIEALSATFLNRVKKEKDQNLISLCLKKEKNAFWRKIGSGTLTRENLERLKLCRRTTRRLLTNRLHIDIEAATHYHHAEDFPDWSLRHFAVKQFDNYLFYRLV